MMNIRFRRERLALILVLILVLNSYFYITIEAVAQGVRVPDEPQALTRSFWALAIQDADTGEELVGIRSHHLMTPASTLKLVSTATLWSQVGGSRRIPTELYVVGEVVRGELVGDLYIVGHGDPSIGSRYFWRSDPDLFFKQVAKELKRKGISKINGSVVALSPQSDFQANNPRWLAYDMGNGYAPGIWSLNAYDNSFTLYFSMNGQSFRIEPELSSLSLSRAYDITSTHQRDSLYISPFAAPDGSYLITGVYPQRAKSLKIKGANPNPPLFIAHRLTGQLEREGIAVTGSAKCKERLPATAQLLYTFLSPPLRDLISICLVYSHNLFAEGLLRQLTFDQTGLPGHNATQTAIQEVHRYWKCRGIDTSELEMMDGSGLSPENRVSANFLATMLGEVYRADPSGSFMHLIPRAGLEGTLTIFLKRTPLQGKAYLKSGTLRNVVCYAGYVQDKGKTYTVALLVNNFYGSTTPIWQAMEQLLLQAFGY